MARFPELMNINVGFLHCCLNVASLIVMLMMNMMMMMMIMMIMTMMMMMIMIMIMIMMIMMIMIMMILMIIIIIISTTTLPPLCCWDVGDVVVKLIMMMMMTVKRAVYTPNCLQHTNSHGRDVRRNLAHTTCNTSAAYHMQHVACHVVPRDSSAIDFDRVGTACVSVSLAETIN